jgi:hypothetical protein
MDNKTENNKSLKLRDFSALQTMSDIDRTSFENLEEKTLI